MYSFLRRKFNTQEYLKENKANNRSKIENVRTLSQKSPSVQRKADCACGGDCPTCQAKDTNLRISQPNDAYEKEADLMADKVMRIPISTPVNLSYSKDTISGKSGEDEQEKLQRKESGGASTSFAPSIVGDVLSSGGKSLDKETRAFMEPRFNYDFRNVKIHDNDLAAKSAVSINALAYTSGNNIVFNSGQYDINSDSGKRLLAHELTHVVQQSNKNILKRAPGKGEKKDEKQEYIDKIKSAYKVKDVIDGDASFTPAELKLVFEALGKIPAADMPTIQNVIIKRVIYDGPDVIAVYSQNQGFDAVQLVDEHYITITNLAFQSTKNETIHSIAHEVGHAVSSSAEHLATSQAYKANFERNKIDAARYQKSVEASNFAKDKQSTEEGRKAKWAEVTVLETELKTKEQEVAAKDAALLASLGDITDFLAKAKAAKELAEQEFNSVSTAISNDNTISKPYSDSLKDFQTGLVDFYDAQIVKNIKRTMNKPALEATMQSLKAKMQKRDAAFNTLKSADKKNAALVNFDKLAQAQNKFLEISFFTAGNINISKPVKRFYDFVVAEGIVPTDAFSPYAKSRWRDKPGEFYAESFSFFVTDSKKLEAFSKPLFEWFKAGNYK